RRNIKKHHRPDPENDMRLPLFRRDSDPRKPDDKQYLRQDKIRQPELFLKRGALCIDKLLLALKLSRKTDRLSIFHNSAPVIFRCIVLQNSPQCHTGWLNQTIVNAE